MMLMAYLSYMLAEVSFLQVVGHLFFKLLLQIYCSYAYEKLQQEILTKIWKANNNN